MVRAIVMRIEAIEFSTWRSGLIGEPRGPWPAAARWSAQPPAWEHQAGPRQTPPSRGERTTGRGRSLARSAALLRDAAPRRQRGDPPVQPLGSSCQRI